MKSFKKFEQTVIDALAKILNTDWQNAQDVAEPHSFLIEKCFYANMSARYTAKLIDEISIIK